MAVGSTKTSSGAAWGRQAAPRRLPVWRDAELFYLARAGQAPADVEVCLAVDLFEVIAELGGLDLERAGSLADFAITLSDGRRVVGHERDSAWSICVYSPDGKGRLLGYGTARARPYALEHVDLSGDDAGGVLGRAGI